MADYLGYIYRFTNVRGEQAQGIIVDCYPLIGLFGIRMDNKDSHVTLWIRISEAALGRTHELLPPDPTIQWRNPKLCQLMRSGSIAKMIETSRQRLLKEQDKMKFTLPSQPRPMLQVAAGYD